MKIKARVVSTDGERYMISEVQEHENYEPWKRAVEELGLYDDGASHYLLELDDPILIAGWTRTLKQNNPNNMALGAAVSSMLFEIDEYIEAKLAYRKRSIADEFVR